MQSFTEVVFRLRVTGRWLRVVFDNVQDHRRSFWIPRLEAVAPSLPFPRAVAIAWDICMVRSRDKGLRVDLHSRDCY